MNNELMAKSILLGMRSFGVEIQNCWKVGNEIHFEVTVPEFSDHLDVHGNEMSGKLLIKRLEKKMFPNEFYKVVIHGTIRNGETWTKADADAVFRN